MAIVPLGPPGAGPTILPPAGRAVEQINDERDALLQALSQRRQQPSLGGGASPLAQAVAGLGGATGGFLRRREDRQRLEEVEGEAQTARDARSAQIMDLTDQLGFSEDQRALVRLLADQDQKAALTFVAEASQQRDQQPVTVPQSSRLVDPTTGEVLLDAVPPERREEATSLMRNLEAAGIRQGTPEFQGAMLASLTKPVSQVTIADEGELSKRRAQNIATRESEINTERDSLRQQDAGIAQIGVLLDRGVETGFKEELLADIGRITSAIGIEIGDLTGISAIRALEVRSRLALSQILKGPITDREQVMLKGGNPNAGLTTEANKDMVALIRGMTARRQEELDFEAEFLRKNNRLPLNREFKEQFVPRQPLVPPEVEARILQAQGGGGFGTAQAAEPSRPRTQADFDALPTGATYIDPDSAATRVKER